MYRLIAKYRPTMPVLAVVFPRNERDLSTWTINGIGKVLLLGLYS